MLENPTINKENVKIKNGDGHWDGVGVLQGFAPCILEKLFLQFNLFSE